MNFASHHSLPSLIRAFLPALALTMMPASGAAPSESTEPGFQAYRQAFLAFFPAYEMARLRYLALEGAPSQRRGQLNQLGHVRRLLDHSDRTVTAPNNDTLYSSARLDLRLGPVVLDMPAMGSRYYSAQVMNGYTDNVAIVGQRNAGGGPVTMALVGPDWKGELPAHTHLVRSDTHDVWLLIRTLVDGGADLLAVTQLQNQMRLTAPAPATNYPPQRVVPTLAPTPEEFVAVVNEFLDRNPPQGAMLARAAQAAELGIGSAGNRLSWKDLPAAVKAGWDKHWPQLKAELVSASAREKRRIAGWDFPPPGVGQWGDNMLLRASVALRGIAALDPEEALYLSTFTDIADGPLVGANRYTMRIPAGGIPVKGFWSITMYEVLPDGRFFLTPNSLNRFSIGNRTPGLLVNADGSIDILMQSEAPPVTQNWLPAPPGPFRLSLRSYLPEPRLAAGQAALPTIQLVRGP